jgi:drug/metabolite transporter (DMT)-like permease
MASMAKEKVYTRKTETPGQASQSTSLNDSELLFGKKNYSYIIAGIGLIAVGLALMSGGHMPSPDVWDESLVYSPRRITLAPICILAGLVVNVYAIFVKK